MHGRRTNVSDPLARGQCATSSRRKSCGNVVFVFFMVIRIPYRIRTDKQKKKNFTARTNHSCSSARRTPQLQAPPPRSDSPIKTEALRGVKDHLSDSGFTQCSKRRGHSGHSSERGLLAFRAVLAYLAQSLSPRTANESRARSAFGFDPFAIAVHALHARKSRAITPAKRNWLPANALYQYLQMSYAKNEAESRHSRPAKCTMI